MPTVAYFWKRATPVRGTPERRYLHYTNELDVLTHSQVSESTGQKFKHDIVVGHTLIVELVQVEWTPYDDCANGLLSAMCFRDRALWRYCGPLIMYHVVEMHLPYRVLRQFGRAMVVPPAHMSTGGKALHGYEIAKLIFK